ncbi:hypothetical protein WA577_006431 [Blastocystis sp. JDR]
MSGLSAPPSEYTYRVSGHNTMIKLADGKIAKHATEKEHYCYEQMYKKNSKLIDFSATYFGVHPIDVNIHTLHRADSLRYNNSKSDIHIDQTGGTASTNEEGKPPGYLILEDLNRYYRYPCILDIKLGTRTYWDGAPPERVERHIRVCKSTTSGALGIRLCGMRVYRPAQKTWFIRDKKWGKSLTVDAFLPSMATFFYNGATFRTDIIDDIISKVSELRDAVRESNWRFWSSSILITYDGEGESKVGVHLIDFGNCNFSDDYTTPDEGCILALSNIIAYLRLIQNGAVSSTCVKDL